MLTLSDARTLKRLLFLGCLWPLYSLSYWVYQDQLGSNPVQFVERHLGKWTLIFLCLTLAITPLRHLTNSAQWVRYRKMLGLFAFFYATLHLLSYAGIDYQFAWKDILNDVLKHRYVLVGFLAWLLLIPLAMTSTDAMMKRLKQRWKKLHRLIYVIAILGVLHFCWLVKKDLTEPLIYAAVVAILLLLRMPFMKPVPRSLVRSAK